MSLTLAVYSDSLSAVVSRGQDRWHRGQRSLYCSHTWWVSFQRDEDSNPGRSATHAPTLNLVDLAGLEPATSAMPWRHSPR